MEDTVHIAEEEENRGWENHSSHKSCVNTSCDQLINDDLIPLLNF